MSKYILIYLFALISCKSQSVYNAEHADNYKVLEVVLNNIIKKNSDAKKLPISFDYFTQNTFLEKIDSDINVLKLHSEFNTDWFEGFNLENQSNHFLKWNNKINPLKEINTSFDLKDSMNKEYLESMIKNKNFTSTSTITANPNPTTAPSQSGSCN
jgi:hypothetical protein